MAVTLAHVADACCCAFDNDEKEGGYREEIDLEGIYYDPDSELETKRSLIASYGVAQMLMYIALNLLTALELDTVQYLVIGSLMSLIYIIIHI